MQHTLLAVLKVQFTDRFAIKFTASNAIFGPTVMQCKVLTVKQCSVPTVVIAIPNKKGSNLGNIQKHFIFSWGNFWGLIIPQHINCLLEPYFSLFSLFDYIFRFLFIWTFLKGGLKHCLVP